MDTQPCLLQAPGIHQGLSLTPRPSPFLKELVAIFSNEFWKTCSGCHIGQPLQAVKSHHKMNTDIVGVTEE